MRRSVVFAAATATAVAALPALPALGALAALAACWSGAPASTTPAPGPAVADVPAPVIAWRDQHVVAQRLPAIAADGSLVVLGVELPDGARGNPNFTLVVRGRDDAPRETHEVLSVTDADSGAFLDDSNAPLPPLVQRIADANALLERLDAEHHLVPLRPMVIEPHGAAGPIGDYRTAHLDRLTVTWKANQLTITDGETALLSRAAPAGWLAEPSQSATHACENPAFLDAAWIAPAQRTAVILVNYEGSDACWEPDAQPHVVTW